MFTSTVIQKSDDFFGINFIKFLFQTVCTFHILIPMAKCPRQEFASFILLCSVQRLKNRTFRVVLNVLYIPISCMKAKLEVLTISG